MNRILVSVIFLFSATSFGSVSNQCDELKETKIRLAITASNLANVNTTRTPEGGPYTIQVSEKTRSRYEPGHPDADENGDVAYPDIDQKAEQMAYEILSKKFVFLSDSNPCSL